jgi:hypothetical protein
VMRTTLKQALAAAAPYLIVALGMLAYGLS